MKQLKQTGPRCMIWATAMLFDCSAQEVMNTLGHDGLKGVHIQEIQRFAALKGYMLVPYEPNPNLDGTIVDCWDDEPWLQFEGLMLGVTNKGRNHAVAWDGSKVFDPALNPDFSGYSQFWAKIKNLSLLFNI